MAKTKELEDLTDAQLGDLHGTLLVDARHDPDARERLEAVEAERARRIVAADRSERETQERRRRTIRESSDAELEARRVELGGESPNPAVRAELGLIHVEIDRRAAARRKAAEALVRPAEAALRDAAGEWERKLAEFVESTKALSAAITSLDGARQEAHGSAPSWGRHQDLVRERAFAVIAEAVRPGAIGEPGWHRYRQTPIGSLLG